MIILTGIMDELQQNNVENSMGSLHNYIVQFRFGNVNI